MIGCALAVRSAVQLIRYLTLIDEQAQVRPLQRMKIVGLGYRDRVTWIGPPAMLTLLADELSSQVPGHGARARQDLLRASLTLQRQDDTRQPPPLSMKGLQAKKAFLLDLQDERQDTVADMASARKRRSAKKKLPVEEAVEKIVAMMEHSAKSLPEPQRAAMLAKIREIAAATVAESNAEALKQKQVPVVRASGRASSRRRNT